jgi:hypothetical protein
LAALILGNIVKLNVLDMISKKAHYKEQDNVKLRKKCHVGGRRNRGTRIKKRRKTYACGSF